MIRPSAVKCECGRVTNPFQLSIVKDAWIDAKQVAHFVFDCPQCRKENEIKVRWGGK